MMIAVYGIYVFMIRKLEQLRINLIKNRSWDMTISRELYDLLISEKDKINELFRIVEVKRDSSILRVFLWDLISEQVDKVSVPEIWLSKDEIKAIRKWISEVYYKSAGYDLKTDKSQEAKNYKKVRRITNNWFDLKCRFDGLEIKPQWEVVIYDILENFYVNEFFKNMDCNTEEEVKQSFSWMTTNFMQIDWLYKNRKLLPDVKYVILMLINDKIIPLTVYNCDLRETFKRYPASFDKDSKLLLFNQLDMIQEDKFQK